MQCDWQFVGSVSSVNKQYIITTLQIEVWLKFVAASKAFFQLCVVDIIKTCMPGAS